MTHPFAHLRKAVGRNPDGIAISATGTDLTYAELFDSSLRIARVLREIGVSPGDIVGVAAQPILALVVAEALFHEACVGAELPPGMTDLPEGLFDWVLVLEPRQDIDLTRQIILDASFFARAAAREPIEEPLEYPSDEAPCRLNFSSGTTGSPKAIPVSIRCLEDRSFDRRHQWMLDEPYLCLLGLSTGLAFMTFFAQVKSAETFLLADTGPRAAINALDQVARLSVRCFMGSPHQLSGLLTAATASTVSLESVTTIMSAGSVMPDFLIQQLLRRFRGAKFVSTYASSEAGSVALREGAGSSDGFAGTLLDDVEVIIVDDDDRLVAEGQVGQIGIRRAHQPQVYLTDAVTTAQTFRNGFFFPGDTGFLRGRDLYLTGRSSELINAAGVKADPARIESVVFAFDGIVDAAVFPLDTPDGLTRIALVFVAQAGVNVSSLPDFLRDKLGESAPSHLARVDDIPRNHMGKVNRDALRTLFGHRVLGV